MTCFGRDHPPYSVYWEEVHFLSTTLLDITSWKTVIVKLIFLILAFQREGEAVWSSDGATEMCCCGWHYFRLSHVFCIKSKLVPGWKDWIFAIILNFFTVKLLNKTSCNSDVCEPWLHTVNMSYSCTKYNLFHLNYSHNVCSPLSNKREHTFIPLLVYMHLTARWNEPCLAGVPEMLALCILKGNEV
jgi:hypothetical protein